MVRQGGLTKEGSASCHAARIALATSATGLLSRALIWRCGWHARCRQAKGNKTNNGTRQAVLSPTVLEDAVPG